ncbi:c-type cytochrome [Roseiconus nitratireducens]|uniref:C-type cytochrome n=1 Tax=Roseiconus nitratireducens TaxID=2605748 RepID=A0A5M6DLN1_9BACT|nr:PVC-type heme-binding CxxCH protein [Roseiconus nitratireducens]KAA5547162.1 c-type cytochrome [Roseiconus nitratireducens]
MRRNWTLGSLLCVILHAFSTTLPAQEEDRPTAVAGNDRVESIIRSFTPRGALQDDSQPTPPEIAAKQFRLRDGLELDLVAGEPAISQPLFLSWDSRGRMWVVQYRQYQYPAGLKVVRFDQYLRAVFDRVPQPPPMGTPGADRLTVFEDTDGDGRYDQSKDVLTGLNIATSVQVGPKGIWVLNPPYLLHYPDKDHDDVPDGDPEVHLSGFGLQDTHSVANSLTWGPDGWLYGANGSTTAGTISSQVTKGVRFQGQCIWRYHPETKVFEIFAEGGGNTFSLEIDSKGRVFSGTNGGSKRGYHYPQGSYADKNWGKHGPLTNPYAFGYFNGMGFEGDARRFAQAFAIYEGGLFPESMDGTIVAPNSLHNLVWNSSRIRDGSTYRTVDRENLVETDDRWFRPVYCGVGPDGAIYLADWYDTRLSHLSPVDNWHKESGRIYRLHPAGTRPRYEEGDLRTLPNETLVAKFDHPNKWVRRRAALELGWRGDSDVLNLLEDRLEQAGSLEALWAIHLMGELTRDRAVSWLEHSNADIRRWVVRLLGDRHEGVPEMISMTEQESDVQVRCQLASTAARVDAVTAMGILDQLARHEEDLRDPHLPLLCWWALEAHAEDWSAVANLLSDDTFWDTPLARQSLLSRLMQRYAASGLPTDLKHCDQLIALAPTAQAREILLTGLNKAFQGRSMPELPDRLADALETYLQSRGSDAAVLALRSGQPGAVESAIKLLGDSTTELGIRIEVARTLGELREDRAVPALVRLATGRDTSEPALQRVAITALASYDQPNIADQLIGSFYSRISAEHGLRDAACRTLASRKAWAGRLLDELTEWRLKPSEVPEDVVQLLRTYEDAELADRVRQVFGEPSKVSAGEKIAEIHRLTELLDHSSGDPKRGRESFQKKCAVCHQLFGEGKSIGPPLDGYERGSLKFWLPGIVDPSLEIREGFQSFKALTDDGRVLTGMIADRNPNTVVLRTADDQTVTLARDRLEALEPMKTSLMPENLLGELSDQQLRDLFAYLMLGYRR